MNKKYFHRGLGVFILLAVWAGVTEFGFVDTFFLPGPINVFIELVNLGVSGMIVFDTIATIGRVAIAFLIALVMGVTGGLVLGSSKNLYESLEFVIDFLRSLPATAIIPLFLILFGIGEMSKIAVAAFGATLIIMFNTSHGVRHSNKSRHMAVKLMGATKTQLFKMVTFWESLPQTFAGMRIAISITLIIVVVTEMFIGTSFGLGRRIVDFQYIYNITGMYAVIILTGLVGYFLNTLFIFPEKKIIYWSSK